MQQEGDDQMTMPTDYAVGVHEAGHLLTAWALGAEVRGAFILHTSRGLAQSNLGTGQCDNPAHVAAILVAGSLAEDRVTNGSNRVNWFRDDVDTNNARNLLDGESDPLRSRRYAETLASATLSANWPAVLGIADELVQSRLKNIDGAAVERIARDAGARKHPTISKGRPISKAEVLAKLSPQGRRNLIGEVAPDGRTRIHKR
jgi:hypothetical protein